MSVESDDRWIEIQTDIVPNSSSVEDYFSSIDSDDRPRNSNRGTKRDLVFTKEELDILVKEGFEPSPNVTYKAYKSNGTRDFILRKYDSDHFKLTLDFNTGHDPDKSFTRLGITFYPYMDTILSGSKEMQSLDKLGEITYIMELSLNEVLKEVFFG